MTDYARFQWSKFSEDGRSEQVVVRGDDAVQWAEDIKLAKKQLEQKTIAQKMEEFIDEPDMSKAPMCPIHKKAMRKGKFPGSWYCPTNVNPDRNGEPQWCKAKPDLKSWV